MMMIKKTHLAALAVCALLAGSLAISVANETPRIMVLHSYSTNYVWTNLINQSLKGEFKKSKFDVIIRYFYMNTRDLHYRENAPLIEQNFVDTVERFDPQVIVAVDDAAQRIISAHYLNHPSIGVVFSGVNYSVEKYGYADAGNVTGIFEHKPVASIKRVIEELNRLQEVHAPPAMLFLADDSTSSHNNAAFLAMQDWGNIQYRGTKHAADYDDWQQFVIQESGKYDYILVSGYRQLLAPQGGFVGSEEVAQWTQANSRAALIGMNVFNSEDGILLSVGVSPHEQGNRALKMALRIVKGTSPADIPHLYPERYILALSENALFNPDVQQGYKTVLLEHSIRSR